MPKLGYEGGMKYRRISPETKMAAVLEGLRGDSTVADICRKYQIPENLYYRWREADRDPVAQAARKHGISA